MSRGKNRYAIEWDLDPTSATYGEVTKSVATLPEPGVRFHLVESAKDQPPKGGHHEGDGPPPTHEVVLDESAASADTAG